MGLLGYLLFKQKNSCNCKNSLDDNFFRCHRSFLIKKNNIHEVNTGNRIIYFQNGESCLIATRMIKGMQYEVR